MSSIIAGLERMRKAAPPEISKGCRVHVHDPSLHPVWPRQMTVSFQGPGDYWYCTPDDTSYLFRFRADHLEVLDGTPQ